MSTVTRSRAQAAALRYAALGWRVLPLHVPDKTGTCSCAREDCSKPGKHPRSRRGVHTASSRTRTIRHWWTIWPHANVGIATGSELVVVDVDGTDGADALQALQDAYEPLPGTMEALTGRGRHLYFAAPAEPIGNSVGRLGEGLDVRGHGGYVVAPPSQHANGDRYRWCARRRPAPLPAWTVELLLPSAPVAATATAPTAAVAGARRRRYLAAAVRAELAGVASARPPTRDRPGTRNDTLNRAAFRLGQLAADDRTALHELERQLLAAALTVGLPEAEAVATIASGLGAGRQHPRR